MTIPAALLFLAVSVMTACSGVSGEMQKNSVPSATPVQPGEPKSPIRDVDFGNFSYPKLPTAKCSMKEVHLINGEYEAPEELVPRKIPSKDCWSVGISEIDYGDLTGDGIEEAFVVLYAELGGNESSEDVFIFTLRDGKPALLWKFATGDRADGGLRRIYAENGELVVELYGIGTMIGKELNGTDDVGACCPEHYTLTKYKWVGDHFQQDGKEQVFPNPSHSSVTLMPRFARRATATPKVP